MFRTSTPRRGPMGVRARTRIVGITAALALGLSLVTGCAAGRISQTADQIPNLDSALGTVGDVGVRDALISVPDTVDGAVAYPTGSTAPLQFWLVNNAVEVSAGDELVGISTPVGAVDLSGEATIDPKGLVQVGNDAALSATLSVDNGEILFGHSVPMTFHFAHAGDLSINVPVQIPAEREPGREALDIYTIEEPTLWDE